MVLSSFFKLISIIRRILYDTIYDSVGKYKVCLPVLKINLAGFFPVNNARTILGTVYSANKNLFYVFLHIVSAWIHITYSFDLHSQGREKRRCLPWTGHEALIANRRQGADIHIYEDVRCIQFAHRHGITHGHTRHGITRGHTPVLSFPYQQKIHNPSLLKSLPRPEEQTTL